MNIVQMPSENFNERATEIDAILIHYTDMVSTGDTLKWLCDKKSQVSSHYLIDENGNIFQLVPEEKRAWHAGESYWKGKNDFNSNAIGIELANPGHTNGYIPFVEQQIETLINLCHSIRTRWDIPKVRILGHSDVAPRRKQDPGHLFPWEKLAQEGLGLWPIHRHCEEDEVRRGNPFFLNEDGLPRPFGPRNDDSYVTELLTQIGYETHSLVHTLEAFQRHFRPQKIDGIPDNETISLIKALL